MRVALSSFLRLFRRHEDELAVEWQKVQLHDQTIALIEGPRRPDGGHEFPIGRLLRSRIVYGARALRFAVVCFACRHVHNLLRARICHLY